MFEALSDRFEGVLGRLKGKGKLTEADIDDALRAQAGTPVRIETSNAPVLNSLNSRRPLQPPSG